MSIWFSHGGDSYEFGATPRDFTAFHAFITDPANGIPQTHDYAMAAAVLQKASHLLEDAEFTKNGRRNDGPGGEPGFQQWNKAGVLVRAARYTNGLSNDGPGGDAAVRIWNDKGVLVFAYHQKNDLLNDGINGEAAVQEFDPVTGRLIRE